VHVSHSSNMYCLKKNEKIQLILSQNSFDVSTKGDNQKPYNRDDLVDVVRMTDS